MTVGLMNGEGIMKKFFLVTLLYVTAGILSAHAVTTVSIQEDNPTYKLKIQYPSDFSVKAINKAVIQLIDTQKNEFLKIAKIDNMPADVPGKNSLFIGYKTPYQANKALSLVFDFSIYNRGGAHPRNFMASLNFIEGQEVTLEQLFISGKDYLTPLSSFCREKLALQKFSDEKWVLEGSKPEKQNFKIWYFTNNGLAIVFDTYQVAAYVYGPQTIEIPKSDLINLIKPDVIPAVWG